MPPPLLRKVDERSLFPSSSVSSHLLVSPAPLYLFHPLSHLPTYPFWIRLKEELEKHGLQVPAQTQSVQEEEAGPQKVVIPGI